MIIHTIPSTITSQLIVARNLINQIIDVLIDEPLQTSRTIVSSIAAIVLFLNYLQEYTYDFAA